MKATLLKSISVIGHGPVGRVSFSWAVFFPTVHLKRTKHSVISGPARCLNPKQNWP